MSESVRSTNSHGRAGFSIIELLIVLAIIAVLSVVLAPNLFQARRVTLDRSAEAYARNVYTAAQAYLAEDRANQLPAGDCTRGVAPGGAFGRYSVDDPGSHVSNCSWTAMGGTVTVTYSGGNRPQITHP